jgi:hypothetical protein
MNQGTQKGEVPVGNRLEKTFYVTKLSVARRGYSQGIYLHVELQYSCSVIGAGLSNPLVGR